MMFSLSRVAHSAAGGSFPMRAAFAPRNAVHWVIASAGAMFIPNARLTVTTAARTVDKTTLAKEKAQWCILSGFTRFASRQDLNLVLGDVKPLNIDPVLDANIFSTGRYALKFGSTQEVLLLGNHIKGTFPGRYELKSATQKEVSVLTRASQYSISDCTIRLRYVQPKVTIQDLACLFEDFLVQPEGIIPLALNDGNKHFLVHFANAGVVSELNGRGGCCSPPNLNRGCFKM